MEIHLKIFRSLPFLFFSGFHLRLLHALSLPILQLQAQLTISQIRSNIVYLTRTYSTVVLLVDSNLINTAALLTDVIGVITISLLGRHTACSAHMSLTTK